MNVPVIRKYVPYRVLTAIDVKCGSTLREMNVSAIRKYVLYRVFTSNVPNNSLVAFRIQGISTSLFAPCTMLRTPTGITFIRRSFPLKASMDIA